MKTSLLIGLGSLLSLFVACADQPHPSTASPLSAMRSTPQQQAQSSNGTATPQQQPHTATAIPQPISSATPPQAVKRPSDYSAPEAQKIVSSLEASGLPISDAIVITAQNDPGQPLGDLKQYTSKVNFRDNRLTIRNTSQITIEDGGSVETFSTTELAIARKTYLEETAKISPAVTEYDYQVGSIVLRLGSRLTPDQAMEYEKALRALVK